MSDFYVLIFSKYSKSSKEIMNTINSLPNFPINYFSIDHKQNRSNILNFNNLNIKTVPCLLKCSSIFGDVKKYEGNDCFHFFNNLKASSYKPSIKINTPKINDVKDNTNLKNNTNVKENPVIKKNKKSKVTNKDDILEDIPQNSSNIDELTMTDDEEAIQNEKDFIEQILPKNNNERVSLLAQATAMQKSRMNEDEFLNNSKLKNMTSQRI